jgi:hypothetical protein
MRGTAKKLGEDFRIYVRATHDDGHSLPIQSQPASQDRARGRCACALGDDMFIGNQPTHRMA